VKQNKQIFMEKPVATDSPGIRSVLATAEEAKRKGRKVYHLNIGQPDIETPKVALDAIHNYDHKVIEYSHSAGNESYRRKLAEAKGDEAKLPDRDLEMEGLLDVLDGRVVVHHHCHRADDIMTVLRLRDEFGFKVVLHHVSEAWKVADHLAKAKAPCSVIVVDSPGGKIEAMDLSLATGAVLEKAGAPVAIHTDDPVTDSRLFLRTAGLAVRAGMSREKALEALTLAGAKMLELDARIGSLAVGKDADLVVLSGDPLSVRTKVLETWVEGEKVFDRDDPEDRLFAVGGYGAGRDQKAHACCTDERLSETK
jgi:hypothetical protein